MENGRNDEQEKLRNDQVRNIVFDYVKKQQEKDGKPIHLSNAFFNSIGVMSHSLAGLIRSEVPLVLDNVVPVIEQSGNSRKTAALTYQFLQPSAYENYVFGGDNFRYITEDEVKEIVSRIKAYQPDTDTKTTLSILTLCDWIIRQSPDNVIQFRRASTLAKRMMMKSKAEAQKIIDMMSMSGILYITPDGGGYALQNFRGKKYGGNTDVPTLNDTRDSKRIKHVLLSYLSSSGVQVAVPKKDDNDDGRLGVLAAMLLYDILEEDGEQKKYKKEEIDKLNAEISRLSAKIQEIQKEHDKEMKEAGEKLAAFKVVSDEFKILKMKHAYLEEQYKAAKRSDEELKALKDDIIKKIETSLGVFQKNILREVDRFNDTKSVEDLRINCMGWCADFMRSAKSLARVAFSKKGRG